MDKKLTYNAFGDWADLLYGYTATQDFDNLVAKVKSERESNPEQVFPSDPRQFFRAFKETPLAKTRVVILGQDPYPIKGDACGLAFSVEREGSLPASLVQWYKGMEKDLAGLDLHMNRQGNLNFLCQQGVLLLNSALTVVEKKPGSHQEIWTPFIKYVIDQLMKYKSGVIFIGMGQVAAGLLQNLNVFAHNIFYLQCEHPVAGAYRERDGGEHWNCNHVFSMANTILRINNLGPEIKWYQSFEDQQQ